ncbi:MAG: hypothetical protein F9K16_10005 [Thermoanaerobaculia bacterium]|nr:MAG: hypothetical protein F9K16_10005 [Thermoanaerobaculia bacterium]MBZ0103984.1 hypothetical protein [Thermoanaerobaculia bacterium]
MPTVVLLGPQRFTPTLGEAVAAAGVGGRLASVTAGWQEREAEDLELHEHLGGRTANLMLFSRGEDVFERDADLAAAHRERQDRLRELQTLYRIRVGHAQAALRELHDRGGAAQLLDPIKEEARRMVRDIDAAHLASTRAIHAEFERALAPAGRPALARHAAAVGRILERSEALLIAGGHLAILLDRLRLFGVGGLVAGRAVFAWSAGAMAVCERVVLFHHSPPQGYGNTELFGEGLGLVRGIVAFPHARRRLQLEDRRRIELLSRRFSPADCLALEDGGWILFDARGRRPGRGVARFGDDGRVHPLAA